MGIPYKGLGLITVVGATHDASILRMATLARRAHLHFVLDVRADAVLHCVEATQHATPGWVTPATNTRLDDLTSTIPLCPRPGQMLTAHVLPMRTHWPPPHFPCAPPCHDNHRIRESSSSVAHQRSKESSTTRTLRLRTPRTACPISHAGWPTTRSRMSARSATVPTSLWATPVKPSRCSHSGMEAHWCATPVP